MHLQGLSASKELDTFVYHLVLKYLQLGPGTGERFQRALLPPTANEGCTVLRCAAFLGFSDVELPVCCKLTGGIRAEKNRDADYYPEQLKD